MAVEQRGMSGHAIFISAVQLEADLAAGRRSLADLAPLAAAVGARGVEYRDVCWTDKSRELPAVRRQLGELALRAVYTTVTPLCHPEAAVQAALLRHIEDARDLGAVLLRVNLGVPPGEGEAGRALRAAAVVAIEHARRMEVPLSLENNARPPDDRLEDIRAALAHFDSPHLGTNVDFANYVATGQDPIAAIRALAPWINYVHLKDARRAPDGWRSTYLGNGELPLRNILAALDATGRRVPWCLEFPGEDDPEHAIRASLAWLAENRT